MVVRVRVRVKTPRGEVVTSALANSGFETEEPEVVLPVRVAERLGIYPELPAGTQVDRYVGIGGVTVTTFRVRMVLELTVLADDRVGKALEAIAVITPGEDEVILSDRALDEAGIVILRAGEGLWRFTDDEAGVVRRSEARESW